jgi:rubrerythrin
LWLGVRWQDTSAQSAVSTQLVTISKLFEDLAFNTKQHNTRTANMINAVKKEFSEMLTPRGIFSLALKVTPLQQIEDVTLIASLGVI